MVKSATTGTPQDGVLSSVLWNLVLDKLLMILSRSGVKVVANANDIAYLLLVLGIDLITSSDITSSKALKSIASKR